jgi:hypothetical protein
MGARARLFVSFFVGMACVWLGGATGCGSVLYVNQVTRKASTSVEAAKAAEADVYAPYQYTLAVHYLRKAREEAAAADFQAANRFGRLSYQAAETARELAVERAANPGDSSWKPPPGAPGHDGAAPAQAGDGDGPGSDGDGADASEAGDPAGDPAGAADAAAEPAPAAPEAEAAPDADEATDAGAGKETGAGKVKPKAGRTARPRAARPGAGKDARPAADKDARPEGKSDAKEDGQ